MPGPLTLTFVSEAQACLVQMDGLLRGMERGVGTAGTAAINDCYRAIHTISGLAGFLALDRIAALAKAAEGLLEEMRLDRLQRTAVRIDALLRAVERIGELVQCLIQDESPAADDVELICELHALVGPDIAPRTLHPTIDVIAARRTLWFANQVPTGPPRRAGTIEMVAVDVRYSSGSSRTNSGYPAQIRTGGITAYGSSIRW